MKNLIIFKLFLVHSILIAGTMLFLSSCSESRTTDSREAAEKENISRMAGDNETILVVENDDDAKFLMDAAEMHLEKISLGNLAQQRGSSPQVKELGKMMEQDHTKSFTELKALALSRSVSIPTTATEDSRDAHKELSDKTGNDFDKAYSDRMVEHHEDAINLYENASTDSEDPEIRSWALSQLPALRTHLNLAEASKEKTK